jgi:hypothetical protein
VSRNFASVNFESQSFQLMAKSACRQMKSRTKFIGRLQMADGSWGERPELPAPAQRRLKAEG